LTFVTNNDRINKRWKSIQGEVNMNNNNFIGRVASDPIFGKTKTGTSFLKFSLAVDRPENRDVTDFMDVILWAGLADSAQKYLRKGRLIYVGGRWLSDKYEKDGITRKTWTLHGRDLQYLDKGGAVKESNMGPVMANSSPETDVDPFSPWADN
jgi:single-strand DNA-binding protein